MGAAQSEQAPGRRPAFRDWDGSYVFRFVELLRLTLRAQSRSVGRSPRDCGVHGAHALPARWCFSLPLSQPGVRLCSPKFA